MSLSFYFYKVSLFNPFRKQKFPIEKHYDDVGVGPTEKKVVRGSHVHLPCALKLACAMNGPVRTLLSVMNMYE